MEGGLESGLVLKVLQPKLGLSFLPCYVADDIFIFNI